MSAGMEIVTCFPGVTDKSKVMVGAKEILSSNGYLIQVSPGRDQISLPEPDKFTPLARPPEFGFVHPGYLHNYRPINDELHNKIDFGLGVYFNSNKYLIEDYDEWHRKMICFNAEKQGGDYSIIKIDGDFEYNSFENKKIKIDNLYNHLMDTVCQLHVELGAFFTLSIVDTMLNQKLPDHAKNLDQLFFWKTWFSIVNPEFFGGKEKLIETRSEGHKRLNVKWDQWCRELTELSNGHVLIHFEGTKVLVGKPLRID